MDVILYFAAQGHLARIKLFHAVRDHPFGSPCPYDLMVCSKVRYMSALPVLSSGLLKQSE